MRRGRLLAAMRPVSCAILARIRHIASRSRVLSLSKGWLLPYFILWICLYLKQLVT